MVSIRIIHVSLELWGGIFCLIAALCMFLTRNFETNKRKLLMFMQLSTAVLLFMDALAWAYRGVSGTVGFYMVRISNFMVFFLGDLILLLYHLYLCDCKNFSCYIFASRRISKVVFCFECKGKPLWSMV